MAMVTHDVYCVHSLTGSKDKQRCPQEPAQAPQGRIKAHISPDVIDS